MKHRDELVSKLEQYFRTVDQKAGDDLVVYAKTGALPLSDALYIKQGGALSDADDAVLDSLYAYCKDRLDLKSRSYYFDEQPDDLPAMYDDMIERKAQYIAQCSTSEKDKFRRRGMFRKAYHQIEQVFEKDLRELTTKEFIAGLANLGVGHNATMQNYIVVFKDYLAWCGNSGMRNEDNKKLDDMSIQTIQKMVPNTNAMRNEYIANEEELADILCTVFDFERVFTPAVIAIFAWCGLKINEIISLKSEQLDIDMKRALLDGVDLKLSERLVEILYRYKHTDTFDVQQENGKVRHWEAAPSIYFIKSFVQTTDNKRIEINKQYNLLQARATLCDVAGVYEESTGQTIVFNERTLLASGIFARLLRDEKAGMVITRQLLAERLRLTSNTAILNAERRYREYREIFA